MISLIKSKTLISLLAKRYWHIYAVIALVLITSIVLTLINRNQINPDGVSYIQTARQYAEFDFKTAINGYWAPLLSWLLVPFIWLNIDPLYGFRVINILLVLLIVIASLYILNKKRRVSKPEQIAQFTYLSSFGVLLSTWGSSVVSPDLLSGVALTLVLFCVYKYKEKNTVARSILLGLALALLYFSKSVGFYISIVIVLSLISYELYTNKKTSKPTLLATAIFLFFSCIWISLISIKYHSPTISTASSYNFALIGPDRPPHPQTTQGYVPTRNQDDVWAWDDPSYFNLPSWKITEHKTYYLHFILSNFSQTITFFLSSTLLVFFGIFAVSTKLKKKNLNLVGYLLALLSLVVIAAYSVLAVDARYLWLVLIPLIVYGLSVLPKLSKSISAHLILVLIFIFSVSSLIIPFQSGKQNQHLLDGVRYVSEQSNSIVQKSSTIAGYDMYSYCYFSKTRCVGFYKLTDDRAKNNEIIQKMKENSISYYVEFSARKLPDLEIIYSSASPIESCYDYTTDKDIDCRQAFLTVYKVQ